MKDTKQLRSLLRKEVLSRFLEPRTRQICTYPWDERPGRLPTREEVQNGIPCSCSYSTGIEDGALKGGTLLAIMTDEYEITHDPEIQEQAATIFSGLRRLGLAGDPPGFVPRWVLPDGSCYTDSSGDQHTMFPYGLWRYYRSGLPSEEDKKDIRCIIDRIARRIVDNGCAVLTRDGARAHAGGALRGPALYGVLLAAHATSGNKEWLTLYESKHATEHDEHVKRFFKGPGLPGGGGSYGPEQTCLRLRLLSETDPVEERRRTYRGLLVETAKRFLEIKWPTPEHSPQYTQDTLAKLGETAWLPSPFHFHLFRPELWGAKEDLTWREDFREWIKMGNKPGPHPYILWWYGKRPVLCHERSAVRFPLTAFHCALLSGDPDLRKRVEPSAEQLLGMVDFTKCINVGTLIEALGTCVMGAIS
jgi:hypothetical protein